MKKVVIVGLTDKHSYRIIELIEKNPQCDSVKKMYTSFQFFREYKRGDADVIVMDNIPDSDPVEFAKKLRQLDSKAFIVRLYQKEDANLDKLIKKTILNAESISKIEDNSIFFNNLLSRDSISSSPGNANISNTSSSSISKAAGKTVLVVDDFENTLNIVKHSLERAGFNVIPANSAKEALQILAKQVQPNIIITDLNMPNMDGFGFIEQVRTMPTLRKVPVFILTTEFNLQKKIKAKRFNIAGWIQKPYKTNDFIQIITNSLD